jgi:hypothetical protein
VTEREIKLSLEVRELRAELEATQLNRAEWRAEALTLRQGKAAKMEVTSRGKE